MARRYLTRKAERLMLCAWSAGLVGLACLAFLISALLGSGGQIEELHRWFALALGVCVLIIAVTRWVATKAEADRQDKFAERVRQAQHVPTLSVATPVTGPARPALPACDDEDPEGLDDTVGGTYDDDEYDAGVFDDEDQRGEPAEQPAVVVAHVPAPEPDFEIASR